MASIKNILYIPWFLALALTATLSSAEINERVLICGVCRNVAATVPNTIANIEKLGNAFTDYRVIIYENNSTDGTKSLLSAWAQQAHKVTFISEDLAAAQLPPTREGKIARARNIVLAQARAMKYKKYKYLIMVDLDFSGPWPIAEIVSSLKRRVKWDCISANGLGRVPPVGKTPVYWDRYAFRSKRYPLGPEVLGERWWADLPLACGKPHEWFSLNQSKWLSVYSAFGGLAIYKTKTILKFSYSPVVTKAVEQYYRKILRAVDQSNPQLQKYQEALRNAGLTQCSSIFCLTTKPMESITCCEHLPLHAAMALRGYNKFYVNPKMKVYYFDNTKNP